MALPSPTGGWFGVVLFLLIAVTGLTLFGVRDGDIIALLANARREDRTDHLDDRIGQFFLVVLGQSGVLRDPIPGIAHFFTFWGFIIISIGLLNLMLPGFGLSLPIISDSHAFATLLDLFIIFVAIALVVFAFRRAVIRPKQLFSFLHGPWDGLIILGLILLILVTIVLVETFGYAASNGALWSLFGMWFYPQVSGLSTENDLILFSIFWFTHMIIFFSFLVYLPRSKHLHLMATPFNVFFSNYAPKGALPLMENLEEREDYGVSKPEQFTWKQLLDGYACTECGRCNTVCPATITDKPLFPKEIILGVKEALFVQSNQILGEDTLWNRLGVAGVKADETAVEKAAHHEPMVGGIITNDALWACTTCRACMEICPVAIEHVPKIVDMRRYLVMEESDFPAEVTPLFNNIERNSNPWEISNDKRAEWAAGLGVPLMSKNPGADILYWVGCMGSFDRRNQKVATAVAKILLAAKVNFAILGPEECCTGDPARRIGNEYLWQMMAQQNIETLNGYGFKTSADHSNGHVLSNGVAGVVTKQRTIITACPH